ncbi:hypothetical protein ACFVAD_07675 [Sutcliffiella sp. NPDC057660]|uniref:hypothetical protein n=1 Tax=Sutcliffiella sp. NPDC057660 TaxID=3346199 RepID=UPI00369A3AA0
MIITNTIALYIKIFFRSIFIPIGYFLFIGFIFYGFYYYKHIDYSPPSAITTSSYVVMIGILIYLFFGVYLVRIDDKYYLTEVFLTIHNGYIKRLLSKLLISFFSIIILCFFVQFSYILIFYDEYFTDFYYFYAVFNYIVIYWGFSFFISFLIGLIFATLIKGKILYPVILLIYTFIIPLNYIFLEAISEFSNLQVDKLLNLGEPNPYMLYNALYGFPIEAFQFHKKVVFVLIVLFILYLLSLYITKKLTRNNVITLSASVILIVGYAIYSFSGNQQILNSDSTYLFEYYNNKESRSKENYENIKFDNYNILLKPGESLNVEVTLDVTNISNQPIAQINLTLYHELKIDEIHMENSLLFKQTGDNTIVYLEKDIQPNETNTITFKYKGLYSSNFFGNEQTVYLPNHLPWLPSSLNEDAFNVATSQKIIHRVPHYYEKSTNYKLDIKGSKKYYTNLNHKGDYWEGETRYGLTVVSGMLKDLDYNGTKIIYPVTWEMAIGHYSILQNHLKGIIGLIEESLEIDKITYPNQIYFIPNLNNSDRLIGEGVWYTEESLILGIKGYLEPDHDYFQQNKSLLTYEIVPALLTKNLPYNDENFEFNLLFSVVLSQAINANLGVKDDWNTLSYETLDYLIERDGYKLDVINEVKKLLKTKEFRNIQSDLYKEWYLLIKEENNWEQLLNLLRDTNEISESKE